MSNEGQVRPGGGPEAPRFAGKAFSAFLAVADQGAVSLASFATTVCIGRYSGEESLGTYALCMTLLYLVAAIGEALVITPYTVFANRELQREGKRRLGGSALTQILIVGFLAAVGFAGVSLLPVRPTIIDPHLQRLAMLLGGVTLADLLRNFIRRKYIADHRTGLALVFDVSIVVAQLITLTLLIQRWNVAPQTVLSAYLGLWLIASLLALATSRSDFVIRRSHVIADFRAHWSLSRWVLASRLVSFGNSFAPHWCLALLVGTAETGRFSACLAIVMITNPLVFGVVNLLTARASRDYGQRGPRAVRETVFWTGGSIFAILTLVTVATGFFGPAILAALYGNADYRDLRWLIVTLSSYTATSSLYYALNAGLTVVEQASVCFSANLLAVILLLALALPLTISWGLLGVAWSMLISNACGILWMTRCFLRATRHELPNMGAVS